MEEFKISNIYQLETLLKAKVQELQWKSEALEKMNLDFNKNRQMLYDERMLLDKERRRVRELELQLKSSYERIEFLEKDKQAYQQEKIKLQVNCESAIKERDSLCNQTRNAKVDNLQLLIKIQNLEEKHLNNRAFTYAIESSLKQLKIEMTRLSHDLNSEFLKLEREQDYFRQSMKLINQLNQRLVVMGMCAHIHQRDQNESIKYFQSKLSEFSLKDAEQINEMENIINSAKMQVNLDETNNSESDDDLDKQVEAFVQELQNVNG